MKFRLKYYRVLFEYYILGKYSKPYHPKSYWTLFDRAKLLKEKRPYEYRFLIRHLRKVGKFQIRS